MLSLVPGKEFGGVTLAAPWGALPIRQVPAKPVLLFAFAFYF